MALAMAVRRLGGCSPGGQERGLRCCLGYLRFLLPSSHGSGSYPGSPRSGGNPELEAWSPGRLPPVSLRVGALIEKVPPAASGRGGRFSRGCEELSRRQRLVDLASAEIIRGHPRKHPGPDCPDHSPSPPSLRTPRLLPLQWGWEGAFEDLPRNTHSTVGHQFYDETIHFGGCCWLPRTLVIYSAGFAEHPPRTALSPT